MTAQGSLRGLLLLICSVAILLSGCLGCALHKGHKAPGGCGVRNVGGIGEAAATEAEHATAFGEFPWTVAILNQTDHKYKCSGSLIHPQVVMTSGICVKFIKREELLVRAGDWNLEATTEPKEHQERSVQSIIDHPKAENEFDFALLVLAEPFVLDKHINVVCLPARSEALAVRTACVETGWEPKKSPIMQQIPLPIVGTEECQERLTARMGRPVVVPNTILCAGGEGVETRDGGSALVCPIGSPADHRYQQRGIAAWSILNTDGLMPMAYVSVDLMRDWIDEQMQAKGFGTESYTAP